MATDDIRARLAACPIAWATEDQKFAYTKHYRRDVAALLDANEAMAKALRRIATMECHSEGGLPVTPSELREIARAALAGAETVAEGGYE